MMYLFWEPKSDVYGGQLALIDRMLEFKKNGVPFIVFHHAKSSKFYKTCLEFDLAPLIWVPKFAVYKYFLLPKIIVYIVRYKPKVVHLESFDSFYLIALFRSILPKHIKLVFTIRSERYDRFNLLDKILLKRSDLLLTNSIYSSRKIKRATSMSVQPAYSPINFDVIHYENENNSYDSKRIIYVGSIDKRKNLSLLVSAFLRLSKENPHLQLDIFGEAKDKKGEQYYQQVMSLIPKGEIKNIRFHGYVSKKNIFKSPSILVAPYRNEPFGRVVAESIYAGFKTIISDSGGLKEASKGFAELFRDNDCSDLERVLSLSIANTKLGYNVNDARKILSSTFSKEAVIYQEQQMIGNL